MALKFWKPIQNAPQINDNKNHAFTRSGSEINPKYLMYSQEQQYTLTFCKELIPQYKIEMH